jgi:serine protease Do
MTKMTGNSSSNTFSRKPIWALALALVLGGALGVLAITASGHLYATPGVTFAVAPDRAAEPVLPSAGFAPVVKQALPAVVNISSSKIVKVKNGMPSSPFSNDPFFQQFFGPDTQRQYRQPQPQSQREESLGSGVIVAKDGYILTNNHVVDGATQISVDLADKRHFTAKVVGTDPQYDIAVLKIDATNLSTLPFGDSKKLEIGDYVLAIGDPFGIGETVTMGIVSAQGRTSVGIEDHGAYENFIQTDAAINPGNSGGALINSRGELVGINTAIASSSGGNEGIGFAIPIDMARSAMTQIIEHGKVVRGYLGVGIEALTPALAKQFNAANTDGAVVTQVTPGTPAAKAGLQAGDVLLGMNGENFTDYNELRLRIAQAAPNTAIHLKVSRNGNQIDVPVLLGEQPANLNGTPEENNGGSQSAGNGVQGVGVMSGVQVQDLTPQIAHQLGISPSTHGVIVSHISPDSTAAQSGLAQSDVIVEVNRHPVHSIQEYQHALAQDGKDSALLLVSRQGSMLYIAIQPQQQ